MTVVLRKEGTEIITTEVKNDGCNVYYSAKTGKTVFSGEGNGSNGNKKKGNRGAPVEDMLEDAYLAEVYEIEKVRSSQVDERLIYFMTNRASLPLVDCSIPITEESCFNDAFGL